MERTLYAVQELTPGPRWGGIYRHHAEGYRHWFLREGDAARPSYPVASGALRQHMPELVPVYESLVDLAGGGDLAARLLSLWCPTPYLTGCSQAVWKGERTLLVRNYDYHPELWDGVMLSSAWTGRRVIGMLDSLWGVLDGINESGLAVSLAFGGRPVVGTGFGMPLILRYRHWDSYPASS
jgi:predicted choloylglycine hydrolase